MGTLAEYLTEGAEEAAQSFIEFSRLRETNILAYSLARLIKNAEIYQRLMDLGASEGLLRPSFQQMRRHYEDVQFLLDQAERISHASDFVQTAQKDITLHRAITDLRSQIRIVEAEPSAANRKEAMRVGAAHIEAVRLVPPEHDVDKLCCFTELSIKLAHLLAKYKAMEG